MGSDFVLKLLKTIGIPCPIVKVKVIKSDGQSIS